MTYVYRSIYILYILRVIGQLGTIRISEYHIILEPISRHIRLNIELDKRH